MPNYVYSNITFERMNAAAREKFDLLCQRLTEQKNFGDLWIDGKNVTADDTNLLSWNHENIGPKWTTIEYIEDNHINMTSAWSAPTEGVEWLVAQLASVDPNLITTYTYIEEQPSFAGFYVYHGAEMYDGYEDEWEDILYVLEQNVERLSDMKTAGYAFLDTVLTQLNSEIDD